MLRTHLVTWLTCIKKDRFTKDILKLLTVKWFLLDRADYPATFPKPRVANGVAYLTLTGSSYISAITVEM